MNRAIKLMCMAAVLTGVSGCRHELKTPDYIPFIQSEKSGLRRAITVGEWKYTFQYKPYAYIMAMERRNQKQYNAQKRAQMLKGTAWFNLSISRADGKISPLRYDLSSKEEYDQRLDYYLNRAEKDIYLVYDKTDTLFPMAYEFENNYNLSPQETIVVGFRLPKGDEYPRHDLQLSFDDLVLKNGIIKETTTEKDLANIPDLID